MNRLLSKALFFIRRTLSYPMYFLSGFMPRNKNLWVFGSFSGYADNSRFLYEYINQNPQLGIRAIWVSKDQKSVEKAQKVGEAYNAYSVKGFIYPLLAKVYVHNGYVSNINFATCRNAIDVNLWHGIPLKKIEFDIKTPPLVHIFSQATLKTKFIYPHSWKKPDVVLSPSKYVADYSFKSAFRVQEENIIYAQYPRVTYLENLQAGENNPYQAYSKVFLYTPTWRDDGRDFIAESGLDFERLNQLMVEQNGVFLLKFHPATKLNLDFSHYSNIKLLDNTLDPMALMKLADCLITDYSSIFFDYLVLDKPIIYFCFDYENYLKNREMYLDYDETLAGAKAENFDMLLDSVRDILNNEDKFVAARKAIADKFLSASENQNQYIIEQIQARMK